MTLQIPRIQMAGLIGAVLFCACAPVNAAVLQITVEGLPSGLKVSERGEFHRCNKDQVIISPINAGGVALQEHTVFTVGPPPDFGPTVAGALILVPHAVYSGELTVNLPTDTNCSPEIASSMALFLDVLGEARGQFRTREAHAGSVSFESNAVTKQSHLAVGAATDSVLQNFAAPTTLQKSSTHKLSAVYSDTFGGSSIKSPSLALTQPGTAFGHPVQITRAAMTLTDDNKVCLAAGDQNNCAPLTQGGALTAGDVTVQVGEMRADPPSGTFRTVIWAFSLASPFPSGSFTLVATANDADPFPYVSATDNLPHEIDLVPWKPLKLPITVP
jgi:hypothetical protein